MVKCYVGHHPEVTISRLVRLVLSFNKGRTLFSIRFADFAQRPFPVEALVGDTQPQGETLEYLRREDNITPLLLSCNHYAMRDERRR